MFSEDYIEVNIVGIFILLGCVFLRGSVVVVIVVE